MSLLDLITGSAGNQVAEQAENKFGISKNQIIALLVVAAPLVISYLKKKSENAEEADKLNAALDRDHDGSILNNPSQALDREQEGDSILSHIFGGEKANVENQLAQNTGISMDKIGPVLATLAPVIMGYIGQQKQASNVTSGGGLGDLLGGILGSSSQQAQASNDPLSNILGSVLGGASQSSGGGLGDILGSVLGGGNQQQSQQGGLGGLLGSIFGK
ncbi:DUF937 domain-containing protein [Epilithonimonas hungarica]|jgi:Uncharacterized conserved protein|uniref:DUF937 domain-containing protein n=1 Tax=Epilithonimonas hungarica TaxID=454006 RepID=A0A1G7VN56_9FLAO|nr:DUF937 domain-containing protein [Epilithonimonas hungarica]MPT32489.1 DUF937 domain-containing protein [Chryseobacterium sp.]SDG61213.1 hypothetical protein SAMN05421825_3690 [Epilithonimonas hungarica]